MWTDASVEFLVKSYEEIRKFADAFNELDPQRYLIYSTAASTYHALTALHGDLFVLPRRESARLGAQLRRRGRQLSRERSVLACSLGLIGIHLDAISLLPNATAQRIFEETSELVGTPQERTDEEQVLFCRFVWDSGYKVGFWESLRRMNPLSSYGAIAASAFAFKNNEPSLTFREALEKSLIQTRPGWSDGELVNRVSPFLDKARTVDRMVAAIVGFEERVRSFQAARG